MTRFRILTVTLVLFSRNVDAQATEATSPSAAARPAVADSSARRGAITVNPIAFFLGVYSGDAEFKVKPTVTLGVGATVKTPQVNATEDDVDYRAIDVKLRYYPSKTALRGFSVAATAGIVTAFGIDYSGGLGRGPENRRDSRPSIGTEFSYQWLLGSHSRAAWVIGAGMKRMLGRVGPFAPVDNQWLPTARASIGYGF